MEVSTLLLSGLEWKHSKSAHKRKSSTAAQEFLASLLFD